MNSCVPLAFPRAMPHAASALPSYASDILPWKWKMQKSEINPPNRQVVLPPIKHFDFQVVTPSPPPFPVTPDRPPSPLSMSSPPLPKEPVKTIYIPPGPWYGSDTSASVVAEKTAEMICYLWFSSNRELPCGSSRTRSHTRRSPTIRKIDSTAAVLQFSASQKFIQYTRKILETTQVSQSVIVLSLHYIYRLRQQNSMTSAQEGSEFRVAVVALMLANKFVDDNTYTNKTWSEVAGIELDELNRMEREFLLGVDSRLYVDKSTYESWLQLLKGLVLAKEGDSFKSSAPPRRIQAPRHVPIPKYPATYRTTAPPHRPRSTSPTHRVKNDYSFTFSVGSSAISHHYPHPMDGEQPMAIDADGVRSGSKRSAVAAFDDTLPVISQPSKRTATLHTEGLTGYPGPRSAGATFSTTPAVEAFSRLSISHTGHSTPDRLRAPSNFSYSPSSSVKTQTLAQPYPLDRQHIQTQPQHLYFYALSGSPLETSERNNATNRKGKLRYAPLLSPIGPSRTRPAPPLPLVIQSASASPRDLAMRMGVFGGAALQHFPPHLNDHHFDHHSRRFPATQSPVTPEKARVSPARFDNQIPVAYFANAGPPGVQWTASTPVTSHHPYHLSRQV